MRRILVAFLLLLPMIAIATVKEMPSKDIEGARDLSFLKRYEGSFIVDYEQKAFDRLLIPLSPLKKTPDSKNEEVEPDKMVAAEGRYTRILYLAPEGRGPLEVVRNYVDEIRSAGGTALYSCKNKDCGGKVRGNFASSGDEGLLGTLFPYERVQAERKSAGHCASVTRLNEQRYVAFKLPTPDGDVHLAVLVYAVDAKYDTQCQLFNGRTVAMVLAIEPKAREQKMVTVSASEMAQSLATTGRIALYGIYFDTNKTDIKPESKPALEQIALLLKSDPALKVIVAGHTDNVGTQAANLDLSQRRAAAVVAALSSQYGVKGAQMEAAGMGMLSPVASNDAEEGRAKNRRVELVKK